MAQHLTTASDRLRHLRGAGCCMLALFAGLAAAPVAAQTTTPATPPPTADVKSEEQAAAAPAVEETGEDVVVSGSRIDRPGFTSPTPLTRVSAEELSVGSRVNVGAALADLPQFKAGQSPQTSGTNAQAGRFPVDLRGLGATRTLVLLDGRRFSSDNDLSTIPSILVGNVDIVTGGASAAWGSNAVAGVVNIRLDTKFTGLKVGAEAGISRYRDGGQYRVEGALGTDFAGERGHFLIGGEYVQNEGITPKTSRPNTGRWVLLNNGNGTNTLTPNVGYANAFYGGIITTGTLAGLGFNPDGSLRTTNRGAVNGTNLIGGESPSDDDLSPLVTPQKRVAGLARASYEVSDDVTLIAEGRYSRYFDDYIWFGDHNRGNITIRNDNAFLNAEAKRRLALAGQTSFTLGRFNSDLSYTSIDLERDTYQGTLALEGSFADNKWRYSAYYSHGEYQNNIDTPGFRLTTQFANAVDAIISPTTGQPICRIALTNPTTNCVPLNLFGVGAPSAAAIAYVTGTPTYRSTTTLDTLAFTLRGEPVELWAGPVSVAVGVEGRRERLSSRSGDLDRARAFTTFSFAETNGYDTVKEAFGEILVPLAKDLPVLRDLSFNGAVRASDYRNSGTIWSWKLGATNEFLPGVIGRVTRSRDIRAPSLSELFSTQTISYVNVADPVKNVTVSTLINGGGNPFLQPEKADTWTAGVTASPMRRLTASLDYFDIDIRNVIQAIGAQDVVTRCFNGNQDLCSRVFRDAAGNLVRVQSNSVNLSQYKTNGIDGEIAYTLPLDDAARRRLNFRVVGTWVDSLTTYDGIARTEYINNTSYAFVLGMPRWRVNGSIGYADEVFNGLVRARYISPGFYNRNLVITNNKVPAYLYVDLQLGATIPTGSAPKMEIYANISNLFDKDPPIASLFSPFYDVIGRFMTVGARVKF